ncbi:terminase small subunit [Aquitalea magnusonii]|jgi:phage terminase Nu1 subunit (DNA packaging protein)|uniref:Phage terminase Nu1 subunit (DNA packaging protein) n=1 Tax=Aquitalea magnusonii TaxID=332411 RepID=A0A318JN20_9NEIS|nr:terminase small subunit [Aquitalea magnusonii]PXX49385.1 phage terminase Nu1 subunit (DNA packaging protein) [Aquitalea magnusonii]
MVHGLARPGTQAEFGALVGISQPAVSDLLARGIIAPGGNLIDWLQAYCAHLREQAAGRAADGGASLVQERARLAKEQADKVAMLNERMRRELAPVWILEIILASMGRQVAGVLEAIPIKIKRQSDDIPTSVLEFITREITTARNLAASVEFDWSVLENGQERDSEGHQAGSGPDGGS